MVKKKDNTEDRIVAVEEALSKTEQFIESNQKYITYAVGALILITLLFFGYKRYISQPNELKAQKAIFHAEDFFAQDSLDLALNGSGESVGFLEIIDNYGSTKTGNLARYYAGICYLNKGDYEEAIKYLKAFDSDDLFVSGMALGAIGDAYMQLGNLDKAISYYLKAADNNTNDFNSPTFLLKAGWAYEIDKNYSEALSIYERVKKEFPKTREASDMDKYIARVKSNLGEL